MPNRWTRRGTVCIAALTVPLLALAACGGGSSGSKGANASQPAGVVHLTFWSWVPGISGSVALWNKSHPNIQVTVNEVTAGNSGTYAKMFTALQAGTAPDLGQVEYDILPNFEHVGGLVDLSKYGANSTQSQFVPWTVDQVVQGGAMYAVPQDTGPMGLFYNAKLFKKYNLTVPTTWAQYLADAKKLHAANPKAYIAAFPAQDPGWFSGLAWQNSAKWFGTSTNSWTVSLNDSATTQVANLWQTMLSEHLVKSEPDFANGWYKDLSDGTLLTWPSAVWGENTIQTNAASTKGQWRVTTMPSWGSGAVDGNWGGSTTVVFKDSKHPQQATQFAEWLNTNQASITNLITKGGLYPADSQGDQQPVLNKGVPFYGGQNIWQVFATASKNVDTKFQWGPIMNTTYTQMGDAFSKAASGKGGTLSSALGSTQSQTVTTMKQQGFSVNTGS